MVYLFFVVFFFLCFVFSSRKSIIPFAFLISFSLILFSGLRYNSGVDYQNYLDLYQSAYFASTEYFYWTLSILHKSLFNSFPLFVFLVSFFTIVFKIYVLKKLSVNFFIAVYIYICISYIYVDMGFIRNSIALMFYMFSVLMLMKGSKKSSYVLFVVAFFFHHSVFFMFFMFFIDVRGGAKISRKYLFFLFVFFFLSLLGFFKFSVFSVLDFFSGNSYVLWKIRFYLDNKGYSSFPVNIYNSRFLFLSLFFYFFRSKIDNHFFIKIYVVGCCFLLLLGFNVQLYTRLGLYLSFFEILLFSDLISSCKGRQREVFIFIVITLYGVLFLRTSYIMNIFEVKFL